MPFSFHVSLPEDQDSIPGAPTRIVIAKSIEADILNHSSNAFTPEDVIVVHCSPQSVFRVRPATRCSSTLTGKSCQQPAYSCAETPIQDTRLQSYARHSHQLVISSPQALGTQPLDFGISTRKRPHILCPVIKAGFCAWNGRQWSESWRLEGTMVTYVFLIALSDEMTRLSTAR